MTTRGLVKTGMVLLLAGGSAAWFHFRKPDGPVYDTAVVGKGSIASTVAAVGTLQPKHAVDVGAQVSGQILKLHIQPGDVVEKGRLLVEIDASVHQSAVDAGRAALAGLRARLAEEEAGHVLARQQLDRQKRMAKDGATREEDLQIAEAALASAVARIAQSQAEITQRESTLKGDEAQLGYTRIFAPMAGTVVSLEAKEGQTINATYQTPTVLRIAGLEEMTVWTAVAEADIHLVKAGMPASFSTLGKDDRRWNGTLRQVLPMPPVPPGKEAPSENGKVVQYTALFDVRNEDGFLLPQMTAQVSVLTDEARDVLVAPLAGLVGDAERPGVFQARVIGENGQPVSKTVRLGKRDRRVAQVLEGLASGDKLIIGERPAEGVRRFVW